MEVEFKVESDHLSRDDPAIEAATDKYTSMLLPFGRRNRAYEKLKQEQNKLLGKHGIKEVTERSTTILKVTGVETEGEAWEVIGFFKEDLDQFYRKELGLEVPPIELTVRA